MSTVSWTTEVHKVYRPISSRIKSTYFAILTFPVRSVKSFDFCVITEENVNVKVFKF